MIVGPYLEFKALVTVREVLFLLWSAIILLNALDDVKPRIDLFMFWILSLLTLILRFIIMAIEIVIFVKVLSKSFLKKMILDFKKSDLTISEMYF